MTKTYDRSLCWFRRDLRMTDHRALGAATQQSNEVIPVFVFDTNILSRLKDEDDRRLTFIYESLEELSIVAVYGDPVLEIPKLAEKFGAEAVFTNHDYEPYAKSRDEKVKKTLEKCGIDFYTFKDHVIFEGTEILNKSGQPYRVFTAYKNAWLKKIKKSDLEATPVLSKKIRKIDTALPRLESMGFKRNKNFIQGGESHARQRLKDFIERIDSYDENRNIPSIEGTSGLSTYFRFGNISIREAFRTVQPLKSAGAKTWISELIWRDFFQMILDQFPHVVDHSFLPQYDKIKWPGKQEHFKAWCEGRTGFSIVDAAMRCLVQTGWMHNRLRMIVASFLVKDLLIDWRKGEAFFARYLLDYDLAANNGGWQWCASTGCDAQPYFRVFNPTEQAKKFDPNKDFVRRYCEGDATSPIVDHKKQREIAISLYRR